MKSCVKQNQRVNPRSPENRSALTMAVVWFHLPIHSPPCSASCPVCLFIIPEDAGNDRAECSVLLSSDAFSSCFV